VGSATQDVRRKHSRALTTGDAERAPLFSFDQHEYGAGIVRNEPRDDERVAATRTMPTSTNELNRRLDASAAPRAAKTDGVSMHCVAPHLGTLCSDDVVAPLPLLSCAGPESRRAI